MSGGTDDSNNIESSMNTDFIPELDHEDFVSQQQHDLGSPDVVSLSEGLSTSDGPTPLLATFRKDRQFLSVHSIKCTETLTGKYNQEIS